MSCTASVILLLFLAASISAFQYAPGPRRRLVLDGCARMFPPRESSYWIYLSSADRLEHLSVADNPHFGLEVRQEGGSAGTCVV